ncbi:integral peroxisomal membrane peroxin-domain-containing protein [Scheffersomyces coipomensis]|uniref:integral peroxisomal membrane peroxin-domain-containing protein n=1 Tax=Scheffersomyces coipomensis TaxID=1788519 RepID=UPI00315DF6E1
MSYRHIRDALYEETSTRLINHMYEASQKFSKGSSDLDKDGSIESDEGDEFTDEQMKAIESMAASAEEQPKKTHHFMDKLMEKMIQHVIPDAAPEKEILERKMNDPEYNRRPKLSIRQLISNFKKLSGRMSAFFALQYGLIHVITWRKPTKTLTVLVFYTAVCLWPHVVLAFPVMFVLFGILLPGYLYRHPKPLPDFIKVKKRGQSLLTFLSDSEDSSIVDDFISEGFMEDHDPTQLIPSVSRTSSADDSSDVGSQSGTGSADIVDDKKERASYASSQVALLMNMRDLQNLTTDVLEGINAAEIFWYKTAGFENERLSTFLFYGAMLATSLVLFLGQFMPWRLIFIQSGWLGLILCHPKSKKYLVELSQAQKKRAALKPKKEKLPDTDNDKEPKEFDRKDIIIDDSPEVKVIEIYELQTKNILHNKWSFYRYSNNMFDIKNKVRVTGKRPVGVDHLAKVLPPKDWKFDFAFANKWKIDNNPKKFLHDRDLDKSHLLETREDADEGWIYDKKHEEHEIVYEFRRRRLHRECYRYAREPRKPSKFM